MYTLTCALGEVGDISVVEGHLIFQQVSKSSKARTTNDAHQRAHCGLSKQPVSCSPALLIAVPAQREKGKFLVIDQDLT